jgi:hypothetical protein
MRSLAKRLVRLESAFLYRPEEKERNQVLAELTQLSPEQRREQIQLLATRILKDRGIEPAPGERIEDAAVRAIRENLRGNGAGQIRSLSLVIPSDN